MTHWACSMLQDEKHRGEARLFRMRSQKPRKQAERAVLSCFYPIMRSMDTGTKWIENQRMKSTDKV